MEAICRECGYLDQAGRDTCPDCHGNRLIESEAFNELSIAHVDCDAFYASVEKRDNPELERQPVIVGGGRRGVVATCCYIARLYGVRSAMPMFKALKACPHAVVVKPRFEAYSEASGEIRALMTKLTPLVQFVSIDEAYLDLSGTEKLTRLLPAQQLVQLSRDIKSKVGVSVSIGLSSNKFLAKMASEMDKPKGFSVLHPRTAGARLAPQTPRAIHGVGPKLAAKLERDGYGTIADLQEADLRELISAYGETGVWLKARAHGQDNRAVSPVSDRKSISSETTFSEDIRDPALLEDYLWYLCVKVADRAKAKNLDGSVVTLKLKRSDFRSLTRRVTLPEPTQLARRIFTAAKPLLSKEAKGAAFRLIGVGISNLSDAVEERPDLIETRQTKLGAAERAADIVRQKFGREAVKTGRAIRLDSRKDANRRSKET